MPWAWGINGCASVISAVLASLLALHLGFSTVLLAAVALYALAALVFPATAHRRASLATTDRRPAMRTTNIDGRSGRIRTGDPWTLSLVCATPRPRHVPASKDTKQAAGGAVRAAHRCRYASSPFGFKGRHRR